MCKHLSTSCVPGREPGQASHSTATLALLRELTETFLKFKSKYSADHMRENTKAGSSLGA